MSAPTRGMVAGQAIQSQAQTKEFDEGYERIFGKERKPCRGRFVYDAAAGEVVEKDAEWTDAEIHAAIGTEELTYGDARATDGTPINTRKRHREYLKSKGLCMASDYSAEYQANEAARRERAEDKERREMVERNVYKIFGS